MMIPWNKGLNKRREWEYEMSDLRKAAAAPSLPTKEELALEEAFDKYVKPAPKPAKTWKLRIGAYKGTSGTMILFSFPSDIMKKFPGNVKVERLDEENWKFSPGDGPKFVPYHSDRVKLNRYDPKAGLFASSPGEAIESDDDVLVCCPLATRAKSKSATPWPAAKKRSLPEPLPAPATAGPPPVAAPPSAPMPMRTMSLEAGMREVIREIRDIEAACPYRLTRLDNGRIVWRAPVIE